MIIEILVAVGATATAVSWISLHYADRMHKRQLEADNNEPKPQWRVALEHERESLEHSVRNDLFDDPAHRAKVFDRLKDVNDRLEKE